MHCNATLCTFRSEKHHCSRSTAVLAHEISPTAIRAIPTLYGETAQHFESEANLTEQNPGTEDYRHEAQVVSNFLKTCDAL